MVAVAGAGGAEHAPELLLHQSSADGRRFLVAVNVDDWRRDCVALIALAIVLEPKADKARRPSPVFGLSGLGKKDPDTHDGL